MRFLIFTITILLHLTSQSLMGMKSIRPLHTERALWPPLLWIAHESPDAIAKRLKACQISLDTYIKSELESARKNVLFTIQKQTALSNADMLSIANLTGLIRSYDMQTIQHSFPKKISSQKKKLYNTFPIMSWLSEKCPINFEVEVDQEMPFGIYYTRPLSSMIIDVDNHLIFAHLADKKLPLPQLILGPSFTELSAYQQDGALARQIAGHMCLEHATEWYLFNIVMKKRKISQDTIEQALTILYDQQELEADLLAAVKHPKIANSVLAWLEGQAEQYEEPYLEERIKNVQMIFDVMTSKRKQ